MITYQITSMAIGVAIAVVILFLVRRDHLHGPYAIWWIGVAATVGILGFFPRIFISGNRLRRLQDQFT